MNVFPFVAKPLIKGLFRFDDAHFDNFILERKTVVYDTIINSIVEKK